MITDVSKDNAWVQGARVNNATNIDSTTTTDNNFQMKYIDLELNKVKDWKNTQKRSLIGLDQD